MNRVREYWEKRMTLRAEKDSESKRVRGDLGVARSTDGQEGKERSEGLKTGRGQKYTAAVSIAYETIDVYRFGGSTEWALLGWMRPDR